MKFHQGHWHSQIISAHAASIKTMTSQMNYLEIGVLHGDTFNLVLPNTTYALAVDIENYREHLAGGDFWQAASDEFFADYREDWTYDIIFIDGLHTSQQVENDFENSLKILKPGGYIYLHDTWPQEKQNTVPGICGDVWKFAERLEERYENCITFRAFPGLTVVQPDPVLRGWDSNPQPSD